MFYLVKSSHLDFQNFRYSRYYIQSQMQCTVNKMKSIIFYFQTDSKYNTYFPRLQAHLGYQKFKGKFLALFRFFFCACTFIKHWIQVENANKACLPIVTTVQSKSTVNKNGFQTSKLTKFFHIAASAQKNGSFSFRYIVIIQSNAGVLFTIY